MAAKKTAAKKVVKEVVDVPTPNVRACTEQDLIDNPEWVGSVNVGDMIEAPAVVVKEVVEAPKAPKKANKGGYAIVTNGGEYIRIYEDKDVADGFVAKNQGQRMVVDASEITKLSVSFDVLNPKTGVISQAVQEFSFAKNGEGWKEEAIRFTNANRGTCKYK